jgi:hypothetical protein
MRKTSTNQQFITKVFIIGQFLFEQNFNKVQENSKLLNSEMFFQSH